MVQQTSSRLGESDDNIVPMQRGIAYDITLSWGLSRLSYRIRVLLDVGRQSSVQVHIVEQRASVYVGNL